jgi:hypothetical protein
VKPITLMAAGALALAGSDLLAYQILESHFHVEVSPDKYVDQLVLRCEDGRQMTVPWQSKLAEACGEDLMGNVTTPPAKANAAPIDEQQKQAMMEQLRSQYGNISDKQVEFFSGPTGVSTRFKPPIVEILKKYEGCRQAQKDKAYCAAERDKALARLADPKPAPAAAHAPEPAEATARETVAAAAPTEPAARASSSAAAPQEAAALVTPAPARVEAAAPTRAEPAAQAAKPEPAPQAAVQTPKAQPTPQAADTPPTAPPSEAEARAAAEQKILQEYMACMRAKPKFDCDQARAKAVSALEKPKAAQKKPQRKPASSGVGPQAQR